MEDYQYNAAGHGGGGPASSRAPGKMGGFYGKASGMVANHSGMALAIIILLVLIIVGYFVYNKFFSGKPTAKKKAKKGGKGEEDPPADPETEAMIQDINAA